LASTFFLPPTFFWSSYLGIRVRVRIVKKVGTKNIVRKSGGVKRY
jgi:hypothetical protein